MSDDLEKVKLKIKTDPDDVIETMVDRLDRVKKIMPTNTPGMQEFERLLREELELRKKRRRK